MWKCYVKKDVMDHLLITFVPASFDDLLMLNPSSADASPEDTGAVNFPVSVNVVHHLQFIIMFACPLQVSLLTLDL